MNSSQYEKLTSQIADSVFAKAENFPGGKVKYGAGNKWKGQSGYRHQLDVTVEGAADIIIVECKYWRCTCVEAQHLLTFVGRIVDLRPVLSKEIHPVMVTPHHFQRGCSTLAKFYGIDLQ